MGLKSGGNTSDDFIKNYLEKLDNEIYPSFNETGNQLGRLEGSNGGTEVLGTPKGGTTKNSGGYSVNVEGITRAIKNSPEGFRVKKIELKSGERGRRIGDDFFMEYEKAITRANESFRAKSQKGSESDGTKGGSNERLDKGNKENPVTTDTGDGVKERMRKSIEEDFSEIYEFLQNKEEEENRG
jgi:hypothetical protein